jgi:hypothetical protein
VTTAQRTVWFDFTFIGEGSTMAVRYMNSYSLLDHRQSVLTFAREHFTPIMRRPRQSRDAKPHVASQCRETPSA